MTDIDLGGETQTMLNTQNITNMSYRWELSNLLTMLFVSRYRHDGEKQTKLKTVVAFVLLG